MINKKYVCDARIHMRDQWRISIIKYNKRRHQVMQVCKNIVNFVLSRCSNYTICLVNSKECSFLQAENSQKFVFYIVLFSSLDHLQCMRHHMGYEILGRHNIIAEHNYCVNWAYHNYKLRLRRFVLISYENSENYDFTEYW